MVKFRWAQIALAAIAALVIAVGCGGGGGGGDDNGGGGGGQTGTSTVSIAWPAQSRLVNAPSTALSARIELISGGTAATSRVVNRLADPAAFTQDYTLDAVPTGTYTLQITFFAQNDAAGDVVATASKAVTIVAGTNDLGDVAVTGEVSSLNIPPQSVNVGATVQLTATALDDGTQTIALPDGAITWSIVSGDANADLNAAGEITGVAPGDVVVEASVDNGDNTVTAQQTITVGASGSANAQVTITWPTQSRVVDAPSTAQSALIALLNPDTQATVGSRIVNRLADPAGFAQTYTIFGVPPGTYTLRITFFSGTDASGDTVATASKSVTLNAGDNDLGDVAVNGNVASIDIPTGQTVAVGSTVQLTANALDAATNVVAIADGAITWTIVSGETNANINAAGEITGVTAGDVTVEATIDNGESNVSAQQVVTVTAVGPGAIVVTPDPATVLTGGTRTFTADQSVTWSVLGGDVNGTITATGKYTAPAIPGTYTVVATSTVNPAITENVQVFVGNATADIISDVAGGDLSAGFNGVSGNGAFAVGFVTPDIDNHAARYGVSSGVLEALSGVGVGQAFDADLTGATIVGSRQQATLTAFTWSEGTGVTDLSAPGGATSTAALGINVDGTIIVGRALVGSVFNAVRWIGGTPELLTSFTPTLQLTNPSSDAVDVNDNGNVIVGQSDWDNNGDTAGGVGTRPVRWSGTGSGPFSLGLLSGGSQGRANAVSSEASSSAVTIVGESATTVGGTHTEAFRWTQGTGIVGLGDLSGGGLDSRALDVSANGSVIVGEGSGNLGTEAFIWDSTNGMQRLQDVLDARGVGGALAGWTLRSANGVSRDGRVIVGVATRPNAGEPDGTEEAGFVVFLP